MSAGGVCLIDGFANRRIVDAGCCDTLGCLSYMEPAGAGHVRFWICQPRGNILQAVSSIVLPIAQMAEARLNIGRWLQMNGYQERRFSTIQ